VELQRLGFTTNFNRIGIHDGSDDAMVCTVRLSHPDVRRVSDFEKLHAVDAAAPPHDVSWRHNNFSQLSSTMS
jgi:hypothetical protein